MDMAVKTKLYLCNIQGVSVYTNYMFRPLLVRPSSGWTQRSEDYITGIGLDITHTHTHTHTYS
jgi:hypothetical protein